MNEQERLQSLSEHWEQTKRAAKRQLEYAKRQHKLCQQRLAELALKNSCDTIIESSSTSD